MKRDFTQYLMMIHGEKYSGLDDDMVDAFDAWVCELDVEKMIKYAEEYARRQYQDGVFYGVQLAKESINNAFNKVK